MSILSIAFPVQAAVPVAQAVIGHFVGAIRPLIGLGLLIAFFVIFKPLIVGLFRAALLVVKPRQSREQRASRRAVRGVLMLNRLADDVKRSQPSLAAELRTLASRG